MKAPGDLARTIEIVLMSGLVSSAGLLLAGLASGSAAPLQWGILLLLLTPVARVVVLTVGLLHERDWLFGGLSLLILGVLGASMLAGAKLP
ncbi:MAG TPA: DUF1634 domain-containing protein [Vicinamibacteria bacterium]|nr:DUF1634 domain-containing protein [Vicinamibacteria bacterium]